MKADFEKGTKVCPKCKMKLPIEMFGKCKTSSDGLNHYCKKCASRRICDYLKSEKGRRKRREYYSLEYVKEKNRKRGNKRLQSLVNQQSKMLNLKKETEGKADED